MDILTAFGQLGFGFVSLFVGIGLLLFGGNLLVDGGVAIARRLGISALIIGLTIIAFSTSSPELALNIVAALNGNSELSLGNIFGSNIANLGLVLGIGALICKLPVTSQVVKWELPWLATTTLIVCIITLFAGSKIAPAPLQGLGVVWGILFLILFSISMWKWYSLGKKQSVLGDQSTEEVLSNESSLVSGLAKLIGGLIVLGVGGKFAEMGAVNAAITMGMSQMVIGVTIVAVATSLPEIVTTIIAAKKGYPDLAVGNVIGSNLFNILFVLPLTMFVGTIAIPSDTWVYLVSMLVFTGVAWVSTTDRRIRPIEGGILLLCYGCFLIGLAIWKSNH